MLTPEETQIVEYGKKNGRSIQETLSALSNYRESKKEAPVSGFQDFLGDVKGIGTGIKKDITKRGEKLGSILGADAKGEQSKFESIFQTTTNFLGAFSDVAGQVIKGGVKASLSQKYENGLKLAMSKVGETVINLPQTQQLIENYKELQKEDL